MVCEPRLATEQEGDETVTIKLLKQVLRCSICFDILNEPQTVRTCLHKFCNTCIVNHVRTNAKCPQCRIPIGSKRILRQSSSIAGIINLLVNDVPLYNEHHAAKREAKLKEIFDFQQFQFSFQK
jgi:E3 ubiquitin-protein ligase RNF1/2